MKSKLLSILLALAMALSLLPTAALAAAAVDAGSTIFTDANDGNTVHIKYRILDAEKGTVEVVNSELDDSEYSKYSGNVTIPAKVAHDSKEYSVIGIGEGAFYNAPITSITLYEGLQYIDPWAFNSCSMLKSIEIPASVTRIGTDERGQVFESSSIETITFAKCEDSKLTVIGKRAFAICESLTTLEIPDSVTSIGQDAFVACTKLTSLKIPAGVKENIIYALGSWSNAQYVTFAEGSPFSNESGILYDNEKNTLLKALDRNITSVTVKEGTKTIAGEVDNLYGAFNACRKLESVTLPGGLETIEDNAFNSCSALKKITLPDTVTSLGESAFEGAGLEEIELSKNLKEIGDRAFFETALKTVVVPEDVTTIGTATFGLVKTLKTVVLCGNVTSIGQNAFNGWKSGASECTLIMTGETAPDFNERAFGSRTVSAGKYAGMSPTGLTVLVPSTAKSAYEKALSSFDDITINTFGPAMTDVTVKADATTTLTADVPDGCTLTVKANNDSIATAKVEEDGTITITGKKAGEATLTATIELGDPACTLMEKDINVTVLTDDKEPAVVVPADTKAEVNKDIDKSVQSTAKLVAEALKPSESDEGDGQSEGLTVQETVLNSAAHEVLVENTVSAEDGKKALEDANVTVEGAAVSIVVQPYLDVTVTDVQVTGTAAAETMTLTLDITPMYKKVATTAAVASNPDAKIVLDGASRNAVELEGQGGKLEITRSTEVKIPLPEDVLTNDALAYIVHTKDNGRSYVYTGTVKDNVLTFTSEHGFSTFTISQENPTAATIGSTSYPTLQDAVNDAQNDAEITVTKRTSLSATMSGSSRTITIKNGTSGPIDVTINGEKKNLAADTGESFTYVRPSGSYIPTYAVTVEDNADGTVAADRKSASEGDTVTLTVKADTGYLLKSLIVSDKDGEEMKLTGKGDGKYSFTMPGGKVTVSAVFAKDYGYEHGYAACLKDATCPIEPFADAVNTAWYHDGVHFCLENELMQGVSSTSFQPSGDVTRAQVVTILWRLEGKPVANYAMQFADVAADSWYAEAVRWAASNKIVTGYSDTTFGPNDPIKREQFAAILYRYSQFKGYDVSVGEDTNILDFDDAQSISTYAVPAIQWACGSGVMTGVSTFTLDPQGVTSRAQAATMFMRYCENVNK